MRLFTLLTAAALTAVALVPQAPANALAGPGSAACTSTSHPALAADSDTRVVSLGSDVVQVAGASEVSILCQLQRTPFLDPQTPDHAIALGRICVGWDVCNGRPGWLCVGIDVCNGGRPQPGQICVGIKVCNDKAYMGTDLYDVDARQGEPLYLCSVISWRDADGVSHSSAYDANVQQPGTQCPLAHAM